MQRDMFFPICGNRSIFNNMKIENCHLEKGRMNEKGREEGQERAVWRSERIKT
jgi:hypothetical protein